MNMNKLIDSMNLSISFPWENKNNLARRKKKNIFSFNVRKFDLFNIIFKTDIGPNFNLKHDAIENVDVKLFEQLYLRHKTIKYREIFKSESLNEKRDYFQKDRKSKEKTVIHNAEQKKYKNQVHPTEIRKVFQTILYKVISKEFFGNSKNKKKILKTLYNFMITAKKEPFNLSNLLKQLDVSSMTWLTLIHNEETKYVLASKFIKWLFEYSICLISSYFQITYCKEQRIYVNKENWKIDCRNYVKKMNKKIIAVPVKNIVDKKEVKNRLTLIPKHNDLRPILRPKYTNTEKELIKKTHAILKYLYDSHFKNNENIFIDKYIEIIEEKNRNGNELYIISSDIINAYGSIKQVKLFNIVEEMFKTLTEKIRLEWTITRNKKKYKFIDPLKEETKTQFVNINKRKVIKMIQEFIFETKFAVKRKLYLLCKGIGQGFILSPILCDIYYASMKNQHFSSFKTHGYFFSFVDDNLYLTKDIIYAKQYLEKIKKGIPDYNCWYNKFKLNSNLPSDTKDEHILMIGYLGWKINSNSLEVEPKYQSARYSMTYDSLTYSSLQFRMTNITALKINKLILNTKINSERQILNNIITIAIEHAKRCFALASCFDSNKYKFSMSTIKIANGKIIRKIESLTNWSSSDAKYFRKKINYIIWKAFYNTFSKKSCFSAETKKFRKIMDKYDKSKFIY